MSVTWKLAHFCTLKERDVVLQALYCWRLFTKTERIVKLRKLIVELKMLINVSNLLIFT